MVLRANSAKFKEILAMSDAALEEVLEECGLTAKWEAKGRENAVRKLQKHGMDPVKIAEALELPLNTVFRYLKAE
jgi:hypothetical protein